MLTVISMAIAVLGVSFCLGLGRSAPRLAGLGKMAASCGFIAVAVIGGGLESTYGRLILAGLLFSWWGDLFLIANQSRIFLFGLVSFFLAHLGYAGAFLAAGVSTWWTLGGLILLTPPVILIVRWLHPHLDEMRGPVWAYVGVITLMVVLSIGTAGAGASLLIPLGAVLFLISDIYVARDRFVAPGYDNRLKGLPIYYAAQLILAYTVTVLD